VDVIIKVEGVVHQRILVVRERVIVMDLVMEVVMMDMQAVKEILFVVVTIVRSLDYSITRRMIVVRDPLPQQQELHLVPYHVLELLLNLQQIRDAVAVTTKEEGAVLQRILVMRERVIVMDQEMEVVMMDMLGVKET